jgi:hypothetical protein
MKCKHVSLALRVAMGGMPGSAWMDCCDHAVKELERVEGFTHIGLGSGSGMGVMISAFISREFGFGLKLSQEQLQKVNLARRETKCSDEAAAKETRGGNANKQPLADSPFVVEFEHGANNQGCWRCDHMVLQFEDCIDIVNTLWPEFDCVCLFDHSCGHDCQRPDGLTVTGLNKGLGGAQPRMRDARIGEDDSDVGLHATELTLRAGMVQSMQFAPTDHGPCWMNPAEREDARKDRPSGKGQRVRREPQN